MFKKGQVGVAARFQNGGFMMDSEKSAYLARRKLTPRYVKDNKTEHLNGLAPVSQCLVSDYL
ncbi:hypothetical protein JYU34_009366 [Plutella xylostella]|uniref:Uncharacterized protein n=1 Tax=Plutella xylostella TaxID=51655 RepID=A0ABQ7QJ98_PLUXY|nr:hypothetical protein JYU34_009366 [Plutella xylostella]